MNSLGDDIPQAGLVDMNFAFVECADNVGVNIHAENFESVDGKGGGGRQPDVAKTDEADLLEVHWCSLWIDILRAAQL